MVMQQPKDNQIWVAKAIGGYIQSKGHIAAMIQPVSKLKKEQKSISRQVNLAKTLAPATRKYLNWSDQIVGYSRADHPKKVPCPENAPMVLKAQFGGYDVRRVFMDAGTGIKLIYVRTLRAMNISLNFFATNRLLLSWNSTRKCQLSTRKN
jgi:hypothetical protein